MAATHKNAGASVTIETTLSADEIGEIAAGAAEAAGVVGQFIRLEDSKPGQLIFSVRSRTSGGRVELMTFAVTLTSTSGRQKVTSKITSYKTKRKRIMGLIPLPKILLGYKPYRNFMHELSIQVESADDSASSSIVESGV